MALRDKELVLIDCEDYSSVKFGSLKNLKKETVYTGMTIFTHPETKKLMVACVENQQYISIFEYKPPALLIN